MKYKGDTISQPVVGKQAKALVKAIKSGGYIANEQALATARRIAERIVQKEKNERNEI
ncbi:hypothetical protein [Dyadobacter soli]|uniref:hypothetical protein n=1 Tax=Dyadobacter soli TaxID=659014 RepID=UPI0015A20E98|nr:hypothetical protein [Dyadobacter soli]